MLRILLNNINSVFMPVFLLKAEISGPINMCFHSNNEEHNDKDIACLHSDHISEDRISDSKVINWISSVPESSSALKAQDADSQLSNESWLSIIFSPAVKHLIAGGVAGAVSRTVVSPLERMKILFQVRIITFNIS